MIAPDEHASEFTLDDLLDRIDDSVVIFDRDWRIRYANEAAATLLGSTREQLVGSLAAEAIAADTVERYSTQLRTAAAAGSSTSFVSMAADGIRWYDHHLHPITDGLIVVSRDITEVKNAVEAQGQDLSEVRRAHRFSEALNHLNEFIVADPEMDSVLDCVVKEGCVALGAESAFIDVLEDGELVMRHQFGLARTLRGRRLDPERAPHLIWAADAREPKVIDDATAVSDMNLASLTDEGVVSALCAPLIVHGEVLGFLTFAWHTHPHTWSDDEVSFATRLAVTASLALRNLRAREALVQSEKRFRTTFDFAPVGIAHQSLDGAWLRVNDRLCEILSRSRDELMSVTSAEITHHEDLPADEALLAELVAGRIPTYVLEKRYQTIDGREKWIQLTRSLVYTAEGEPDYVVSIIEDIDERRHAEALLAKAHERERLLTNMLEDASQPFAVGEIGGGLIMCNDAFVELTGYSATDLADASAGWGSHLMPPEWQQIAAENAALLGGDGAGPVLFQKEYVRSNGSVVPVEVLAHVFRPETERPLVYAFLTDVTLRAATEERAALSHALNEIDAELGKQLASDTSLPYVLDTAAHAMGLQCAAILTWEGGHLRLSYGYHIPEDIMGTVLTAGEAEYAEVAVRENRTIVIDDVSRSEHHNRALAVRLDVGSVVAVPLRRGLDSQGAMIFCKGHGDGGFSDAQLHFISTLAAHSSLAIQNAQLYENEHRVAQTLQEALLAMPKSIDGLDFAHAYRSSSVIAKVGGDFYDLFELPNGSIGIVVGDVSGKGLEAAALNARARASLRAELGVEGRTPAEVLTRVNDQFSQESDDSTFFTVFLGLLDRSDGHLVYASGGHTTSALVRPGGQIELLPSTGPVVGAFAGLEFSDRHLHMAPGEVLFAYTDGVIEARSTLGLYGEQRLFESLTQHAADDPEMMVRHVIDDAVRFASRLSDDVAVLALRRHG